MKHTIIVNREVSVVKIAICGRLRSGKDTVGNHLYIKYGFSTVAFGDALKKNAHAIFPWVSEFSKPRALYQFMNVMREYDEDVWIKHAERAVKGAIDFRAGIGEAQVGVVITDLRQPNEYEWARANGFTIVRITAPDDYRIARAKIAGDSFTESDLEHETESHIDGYTSDYEIYNDGSIDDLKRKVDEIMGAIN